MKTDRQSNFMENRPNWPFYFNRGMMATFSRGKSHSRLSVLIYHRVKPQRDPIFPDEVDAEQFDAQIRLLKTCFNIVPLTDAVAGLRNGSLPPRAACISFDDGYADNAEIALPILQKHGVHATFFIAAGFIDGGRMWNDTVIELVRRTPAQLLDLTPIGLGAFRVATIQERQHTISSLLQKLKYLPMEVRQAHIEQMCEVVPADLPNDLMMNFAQVKKLNAAGMEIGGHTVNHPILTRLEPGAARNEIAEGKNMLEHIIGRRLRLFAYPNGKPHHDYGRDHVQIVKDLGFEGAVSTAWGAGMSGDDPYQVPRFTPWDRSQFKFVLRLAQNMLKRPETV